MAVTESASKAIIALGILLVVASLAVHRTATPRAPATPPPSSTYPTTSTPLPSSYTPSLPSPSPTETYDVTTLEHPAVIISIASHKSGVKLSDFLLQLLSGVVGGPLVNFKDDKEKAKLVNPVWNNGSTVDGDGCPRCPDSCCWDSREMDKKWYGNKDLVPSALRYVADYTSVWGDPATVPPFFVRTNLHHHGAGSITRPWVWDMLRNRLFTGPDGNLPPGVRLMLFTRASATIHITSCYFYHGVEQQEWTQVKRVIYPDWVAECTRRGGSLDFCQHVFGAAAPNASMADLFSTHDTDLIITACAMHLGEAISTFADVTVRHTDDPRFLHINIDDPLVDNARRAWELTLTSPACAARLATCRNDFLTHIVGKHSTHSDADRPTVTAHVHAMRGYLQPFFHGRCAEDSSLCWLPPN